MAGWSALSNGSAEIGRSNGHCLVAHRIVDDSDDHKGKARCLFDQLLSAFHGGVLPVPAMLGDGGSADLFELFWVVRKRGGYDLVSRKGSWDLVAEDLGVDPGVTASVKLVYSKYLNELDQWLKGNGNGDDFQHAGNFRLLELKTKFRGMLLDVTYDDSYAELVSIDSDLDIKVCEFKSKNNKKLHDKEKFDDDDEKSSDTVRLDRSSLKRKRESLSGMLNWVIQAAKHSDDPAIGEIPGPSKWKNHGSKELWMQVIRAREAQLHKRPVGSSNEQSLLQKKYKMHPSMYEDDNCPSHQPTARVRCRERLSNSFSQLDSTQKKDPENASKKQTSGTIDTPGGDSENDLEEKHVSVGPRFQAEVPEWTGEVLESDSKWLGTRVWPSPPEMVQQQRPIVETGPIGRGRPETCECRFPGCVECVRFHIAEKRMKLKQELQSVFYRWRFERMGEEISLRWTIEEEKRFKEMVTLNPPSLGKCFWDYAFKYFPTKSRSDLVSYYFNVFLVQRRSYQNRVTPRDIDSDDDESEFGSIGERFGHAAVTVGGSNLPVCTENKQCKHME